MRRPCRITAFALGLVVLAGGCSADWHRVPVGEGGQLPLGQRVQVFHGPRTEQWHAIRLTLDSISGVPFIRPATCDSCRVSLPRTEVDSIRLGDPDKAVLESLAAALVVMVLIMAWACTQLPCESRGT